MKNAAASDAVATPNEEKKPKQKSSATISAGGVPGSTSAKLAMIAPMHSVFDNSKTLTGMKTATLSV